MGYHIINITHYDKIMAVQGSCRVKERGDVNDIYGGGEVQKVGWRFRELFFLSFFFLSIFLVLVH